MLGKIAVVGIESEIRSIVNTGPHCLEANFLRLTVKPRLKDGSLTGIEPNG